VQGQWTVVPAAGAVPACLILATSFFFVQHGKTTQCIILLHPTPASPGRSAALTHHTIWADHIFLFFVLKSLLWLLTDLIIESQCI